MCLLSFLLSLPFSIEIITVFLLVKENENRPRASSELIEIPYSLNPVKWAGQQQWQNTMASAPFQTTRPSMFDRYDRTLRVNTLTGFKLYKEFEGILMMRAVDSRFL